jgi:diguanylate cyclase (GGDEF)-like protein/PAS domain S-box-containing protein
MPPERRRSSPAILLVEDEAIVARDLCESLVQMGYDVPAIADSEQTARDCASLRRPDIVLMDIRIKGNVNGIQTARMLKENFHSAIIYLTAHADDESIRQASNTEAYGYLLKPVKTAELRAMIEMTLHRREGDEVRERLAKLDARLAALTDLNLQLASEREPRVLLEKVSERACKMFGASYAVLVVNDEITQSVFCCTSGLELAADARPVPAVDAGPLGVVYAHGSTWRVSLDAQDRTAAGVLPSGYPPARNYLAVPIGSLSTRYGWLCLAGKPAPQGFTLEDEQVLGVLARQVGRIYENSSLYLDLQVHMTKLKVEVHEHERTALNLRRNEERFRQLAENIQDVFFIQSADFSEMTYQSPAFEQIWGRPSDPTNPLDWTTSIHVDDRGRILDKIANQVARPGPCECEFRIVRPSGSIRWIVARHFPLYDDKEQPYRVVGIATDITERKLAEQKIQHLNRVYAVLSGINGLIVRAKTPAELFSESCRLAVEHGDFLLVWIGWLQEGRDEIMPLAWAGGEVAAHLFQENVPAVIGAAAVETIRRGQPWVCDDLDVARTSVPHERHLVAHGVRSVVLLPLMVQGKTVGCLSLASAQQQSFDAPEMRLLLELAADISFAIAYLEQARKLTYLAFYDPLTGLANRTLFLERLAQTVHSAKRNDDRFAVIVRDPEHFDTINQTFGRNQGDLLLKEVADRLVVAAGDQNAVGHIGSDQFAMMMPLAGDVDSAARALEEQYQAWLGAPFAIGGEQVTLSARAGIAIYPDDATDADLLLRNAEAALKRSSSPGDRNVFFTKQISDRITERLSMENRLRHALTNREFELHYQPKVDSQTRLIVGLEALIRWVSPELGLVRPARFIPLMEETGMIVDVGIWVMMQACLDRCSWLEQELPAPRIAVNVSSVQLRQPDFVDVVRNTLKQGTRGAVVFGAVEAGIDVELTESVFVESAEANIEKVRAIRALGIQVAIDDFGMGYSSLGYLAKMPLDCLKIDRSFTAAMLDDPTAMTLVSTMITLAHSLKLKVIAEGVESEDQARILRLLHCDHMQGYLISKPLSCEEMTATLVRSKTTGGA